MMIILYSAINSKYKSYLDANYGNIFLKDPGVFTLPSYLYSYWLCKRGIKIKGARKISMEMTEFEDGIIPVPRSVSTSIIAYNCNLDFERLISIEKYVDKQLMVLERMHESVLRIAQEYDWDKNIFDEIYKYTYDNIINNAIPEGFWSVKI